MNSSILKRLSRLERAFSTRLSPLPNIWIDYIHNSGSINGKSVSLEEAEQARERITPEQDARAIEEGVGMVLIIMREQKGHAVE